MPDTEQEQLERISILRQMVDSLAMKVVMGDGTDWDGWLHQLSDSALQIALGAELMERPDLLSIAEDLKREIAESRAGGRDRNSLEAALQSGIARITELLHDGRAASQPAPVPGVQATANSVAQDPELIADFIMESREHLSAIEGQLLAVEQNPGNLEPIHSIFRGFHTIKGLAGFLELGAIREVAHEVETVLDLARDGRLAFTPAVVDVVLASADYLSEEIRRVECLLNGSQPEPPSDSGPLLHKVRSLMHGGSEAKAGVSGEAYPVGQALGSLSEAMQVSEAMPDPENVAASPGAKPEKRSPGAGEARAVKVDTAKLDYLVDMVGEMVIAESMVRHNPELSAVQSAGVLRSLAQLGRITGEVQKTAMSMRMVPIGGLFQKMARLVRDLSRKGGKEVEFETAGEDTELDRNIVEELADPLMHMVRNAVDHGIETPEERRAAGKAPAARVTLRAFHQAGHISIAVSDDGRGLNRAKIVAKAREKGLIESADHLSESEIFNLIFEPGFSTADQVTDISGRGVGMDVVRKRIQQLRGRVEIQSAAGQGTTFLLKLPLTLAIIDGLVVAVGNERYIVPVFAVKEMLRPTAETISTVENREEMALVRGRLFPVVRLYRRFGVTARSEEATESVLIIAECAGKDFCLMVDRVIGKQEVVIKSLGETMQNIAGVAGGAIMGDGRVGLILDMEGLFRRA